MIQVNGTIRHFGYPDSLIAISDHWVVLLRPEQPTASSLVLAAHSDEQAFSDLDEEAFAGLGSVTRSLERALAETVVFEKLNYLMLMMVDPHVHFHVIPRYSGSRHVNGIELVDHGWPKAPQLSPAVALEPSARESLIGRMKDAWR